ncbi:MAG: hypothetical protein ACK5P6_04890, partial [Pseudobdellovibrionaceae bacterium]
APMQRMSSFLNNSKVSGFERDRTRSSYKYSQKSSSSNDSNRLAKAKTQQASDNMLYLENAFNHWEAL